MVLEKRLREFLGRKGFNTSVFLIGGTIEVLGFLFLFGMININQTFLSILMIVGGYLLAVSVRKK